MTILSETWWGRELVSPPLNNLFRRCCTFFDSDPLGGGTKGNTAHTYGRHRSFEWCRNSAFCTDRSYGTTDKRDRDGGPRYIRAMDVKLTPSQMREVSHRLDNAVRAGDLPEVAEWFGTFDNRNVVGWYEGHASSSDDSHLVHIHVGVWTIYANDQAALDRVYAVMTGEDMDLTAANLAAIAEAVWKKDIVPAAAPPVANPDWDTNKTWGAQNSLHDALQKSRENAAALASLTAKVDQILAALSGTIPLPPAAANVTFTGTATIA